jgi:7-keto-8-aminopelargonate synthetase-like enzyme
MRRNDSFYDTVDQIINYGVEKGILHLYTGNDIFHGSTIILNKKPVLNFGSCSYLGLEFQPEIKAAAMDAIEKYGTQFSESRAYVSLGLYNQLEGLLEKIFNAFCVITPTTTLGHIANIPVLVGDLDAVIMDQQVHNSVQTAVQLVKARGVHVELVRHNRMDLLEARIKELRSKYKKIWYMADGIYSMFGDSSPVDEIYSLMEKYQELYYYVDDAHGMSIHGKHGRGFVLSNHGIHPKMAMATSLNKAFASGGGVLVYGDKELARKIGNVGGPLLSSGPMQPSALGAAIASAQLHLSGTIITMQEELKDNIRFTELMLAKYELPVISKPGGAIFFIAVSLPRLGHKLVRRMLDAGFYVNLGIFPTVPMKQTGIRFTITRLHSFEQIESMVKTLAKELTIAMEEEQVSMNEIFKAFKMPLPEETQLDVLVDSVIQQSLNLKVFQYESIHEIDSKAWNSIFYGKGTFDWDGMALLEKSFGGPGAVENNWLFNYILIKNTAGDIVLATFLTTAIWKDDMLSLGTISKQIELKRIADPYYLTSKVICCGSLITEGEHLFIDYASPLWRDAMQLFFERIYALQDLYKANNIVIRDFHSINKELDDVMVDNGFFRIRMPDSYTIDEMNWQNEKEFYELLSINAKNQLRKKVLRNENKFKVEIINVSDWKEEIEYWYRLYLNVKSRSLELNTFPLPLSFFYELAKNENWEVLQLTITDSVIQGDDRPCCVIFSYKTKDVYIPMIIGMDYTYNQEYNVYRQALYQVLLQAKKEGKKKIFLGFSAGIEKQKLGATSNPVFGYMHTKDSFNMEEIAAIPLLSKISNS